MLHYNNFHNNFQSYTLLIQFPLTSYNPTKENIIQRDMIKSYYIGRHKKYLILDIINLEYVI